MATGILGSIFGVRRRSVPPRETAGHSGTAIFGGYVQNKERDPRLANPEFRYRTYSEVLANTSIVAAGVRYFLNLVAKAEWKVEPADDTPQAQEVAEVVEEILHDMKTPWSRVVRRAAMYRFYGFSVQEWTAKRRNDGRVGLLDIAPRPQHTIEQWDTEVTGEVVGVVQRSPQTSELIYLPRDKVVYIVDDSLSDSPEGLGLFRHLVEPAKRLERYQLLEAFGYETDLRGVPLGRAPLQDLRDQVRSNNITEDQAKQIVAGLEDFIRNHIRSPQTGLLLDSRTYQTIDERGTPSSVPLWDMELLRGGGNTPAEAVAKAIERLNRELARIMGVEGLLLGADGKGSLALSQDKTQSFGLIVDSSLTELEYVMEHDVLDTLMRLNGWDEELRPVLKTEQVQFRDVEKVTGALADMAQAGAILEPGDPAINEIRDLLGLSRAPEMDAGLAGVPEEEEQTGGAPPNQGDVEEMPEEEEA